MLVVDAFAPASEPLREVPKTAVRYPATHLLHGRCGCDRIAEDGNAGMAVGSGLAIIRGSRDLVDDAERLQLTHKAVHVDFRATGRVGQIPAQ